MGLISLLQSGHWKGAWVLAAIMFQNFIVYGCVNIASPFYVTHLTTKGKNKAVGNFKFESELMLKQSYKLSSFMVTCGLLHNIIQYYIILLHNLLNWISNETASSR